MELSSTPGPPADRASVAAQISREIARLHARLFGRGPTRANTFVYDEFALCVLEDILTPAERTPLPPTTRSRCAPPETPSRMRSGRTS
jgi:uncharacterized protein YbcI